MSEQKTENLSPKKSKKGLTFKLEGKKRLYVLVFAAILAICCICAVYQMTNSRSIIININSASVSKGQNPDGTAFNIYEVFSDEVLEAASRKLDGKISAKELKRHLSVADALSAETNQQLKQSVLDGEKGNVYFPTVYRITYSTISDSIREEGIGQQLWTWVKSVFVFPSANRILEAVADSYQEHYEDSYLTYETMFEIDWESIDTMDYYNRAEALRTEATRVLRFLQDKAEEKPVTGASGNKLTFGDLSNDLWKLIDGDISNHQAYIVQNSITASREELLRQFRYMEEIYIEEQERQTERYLILEEAVDMYDSTTTKVVFIPALDQDNAFYMNRTKVGLDYLMESADTAKLAADEAEHNAKHYQYLQSCFAETVTPEQSQIEHTDAIYASVKNELIEMIASVKNLVSDSNRAGNEGIKTGDAAMDTGIVSIGLSFAKRFVMLSLLAYVVICIYPVLPKKKKSVESQEV